MERDVADQIARFSRLAPARLLGALKQAQGDDRPREETLVHFLRRARQAGDEPGASTIARAIARRVSGRLARMTCVWRLGEPADLAEDVIDEILTDLYDQLFNCDDSQKFWEIRFWVCFNRRAINVLLRRRAELDQIDADEGDAASEEWERPRELPAAPNRIDQPETRALINDALSRLPENQRTAFLLKHWSGFQEEASADGAPSIAVMMGVSGRTVRNYLAKASRALASWREEAEEIG